MRGHVEEIINHLKRVENDYGIDLTSEMEWLRGLNGYKEYLCTKSVGTFEKGETYKAHQNSPIAKMKNNFVAVEEEPVSEDLEETAELYGNCFEKHFGLASMAFIKGAKWQKEQFEKNRLKHCDSITNEQAELEQKFLDQHLDKHQRMPTYLDAIEYGMKLKKEQMIESGTDVTVHIDSGNYPYIPQIELYDYDKDIPLAKEGDKYKMILIKED